LAAGISEIAVGDIEDFRNFMGAVIDRSSYVKLKEAIDRARADKGSTVSEVLGGECNDETGWFVRPTVIVTTDAKYPTMQTELFGPVLTVFVYDPAHFRETLALCDETSPYALTGAIFANDRRSIADATKALRHAAGNFYVNDKPTGAVVGQQPFGGSRASGTNDKAGSLWNLIRWLSPRTIKENFDPSTAFRYPFMDEP
jgi:1-pyrroline-5-carboxylate dehydrogenase